MGKRKTDQQLLFEAAATGVIWCGDREFVYNKQFQLCGWAKKPFIAVRGARRRRRVILDMITTPAGRLTSDQFRLIERELADSGGVFSHAWMSAVRIDVGCEREEDALIVLAAIKKALALGTVEPCDE